jgi:hypothetical protein
MYTTTSRTSPTNSASGRPFPLCTLPCKTDAKKNSSNIQFAPYLRYASNGVVPIRVPVVRLMLAPRMGGWGWGRSRSWSGRRHCASIWIRCAITRRTCVVMLTILMLRLMSLGLGRLLVWVMSRVRRHWLTVGIVSRGSHAHHASWRTVTLGAKCSVWSGRCWHSVHTHACGTPY